MKKKKYYALETSTGRHRRRIIIDGRYNTTEDAERFAKRNLSNHPETDWRNIYRIVEVDE